MLVGSSSNRRVSSPYPNTIEALTCISNWKAPKHMYFTWLGFYLFSRAHQNVWCYPECCVMFPTLQGTKVRESQIILTLTSKHLSVTVTSLWQPHWHFFNASLVFQIESAYWEASIKHLTWHIPSPTQPNHSTKKMLWQASKVELEFMYMAWLILMSQVYKVQTI